MLNAKHFCHSCLEHNAVLIAFVVSFGIILILF